MEQLKQNISRFSDEELVDEYKNFKDEYTEDAIHLIEDEIKRRNINIEKIEDFSEYQATPDVTRIDEKDFVRFDHSFNRIDLETASAILRDSKILFYIDNPTSTDTIPLDSEADKQYTIHIYNKTVDKAHTLLDEHFEKVEGKYRLKNMGAIDQLKNFSFSQLHLNEKEAAEKVEVEFSKKEKETIIRYGNIIINDADIIEKDRVIFYFDVIEPLINKFSDDLNNNFSKTELLTILEILQISCDFKDFPEFMENVILSLISFFLE